MHILSAVATSNFALYRVHIDTKDNARKCVYMNVYYTYTWLPTSAGKSHAAPSLGVDAGILNVTRERGPRRQTEMQIRRTMGDGNEREIWENDVECFFAIV